jgi:hypothetical protein
MITTRKVRTVPLSKFTPELIFAIPELQDDIHESYVRQALIDFVQQSNTMRRTASVHSQAGVSDYQLEPGDCLRTQKIVKVCDWRGNEYIVQPSTPCHVPCGIPVGDICGPGCGAPGWSPWMGLSVWFEQPNEMHVTPKPVNDVDLGYTIELSVVPTRETCDVDEEIFEKYSPVIVAGALKYLHLLPGRSWSNPGLAQAQAKEFKLGCARALGDILVGVAGGNHRLVTRRFV